LIDYLFRLSARFREERFAQLAGSLSFTTLLSLVPIVAISVAVGNAVPWVGGLIGHLDNFIVDNLLPAQTGDVVAKYAYRFSRQASRLTTGGVLLLLLASVAMVFSIERAFNHLWRVRSPRPVVRRVIFYLVALFVFPLAAGAFLALSGILVKYATALTDQGSLGRYFLAQGSAWLLLWCLFSMLYYAVPAVQVRVRHAVLGAAVAAAGIIAAQRLFGYAIGQAGMYKTLYGAFAALPVFLVWLYLCWVIVLVGAVVAATFADRSRSRRSGSVG
jgi:membrane protein